MKVDASAEATTWTTEALTVRLDKRSGTFTFQDKDGATILAEKENAYFHDFAYNGKKAIKVNQCFKPTAEEGLYGLGDLENGRLNQRKVKKNLMPANVGDGIPYLASDRGWAIWWDNTSPTLFEDRPGDVTYTRVGE